MTGYWLGVVQRSHVLTGVELGIAQLNHGKKGGLARLRPGDGFVYYSPKTDYPQGDPLKEFTAIGTVAEGEPWQADAEAMAGSDFRPWRRRIDYVKTARHAPIAPMLDELDLTRDNRNWGYQLRRGLLELTQHDFGMIASAMGASSLEP